MESRVCSGDAGSIRTIPIDFRKAKDRFEREARWGMCPTGRYRMPYYVWGEGPPLVFIHGVCATSRAYIQPISQLAKHYRCIGYDQPLGLTDGARVSEYQHAHLVSDLFHLLDHLNIDQANLYGTSFGTTIAMAAMQECPHRIARAILQAGFARRRLFWYEYLVAQLGRILPGRMSQLPGAQRTCKKVNFGPFEALDPALWEHFLADMDYVAVRAFSYQGLMLHRLDLRPILRNLQQPTLIIWGGRDEVLPPEDGLYLRENLPNSKLVTIEGAGHVPSYTHPEILVELIIRFLSQPRERPLI